MGDSNTLNFGDGAQAKQVAQGQNISQTIIENYFERARLSDARFSIPKPPQNFTGRADEINTLVNALTRGAEGDARIAAITGVSGLGGIGKSALAAVVATLVAPHFPDAQMWIALDGTAKHPKPPSDAMREIIFAFDPDTGIALKDASDAQITQAYVSILRHKHALLVLDNARDNAQVRPLLQAHAAFLITARTHLTEGGLQPLHLGVMKAEEAEAYLVSLCSRLQTTTDGGRRATAELCGVCGHLPLALKLAGSYLAARPNVRVENYVARLKEARLDLLREGREAEANVEATFQQTYDQLSYSQQVLFGALAVFPAPFTLQAAMYVWGLDEISAEAALGELIRASFVEFKTEDEGRKTEGRYVLHDLLREFGERRITNDERQRASKQHAMFYVQVTYAAKELYKEGNESVLAGLNLFNQELVHIRTGRKWAAEHSLDDREAALAAIEYPTSATFMQGLVLRIQEQINWLEDGLSAARLLEQRDDIGCTVPQKLDTKIMFFM